MTTNGGGSTTTMKRKRGGSYSELAVTKTKRVTKEKRCRFHSRIAENSASTKGSGLDLRNVISHQEARSVTLLHAVLVKKEELILGNEVRVLPEASRESAYSKSSSLPRNKNTAADVVICLADTLSCLCGGRLSKILDEENLGTRKHDCNLNSPVPGSVDYSPGYLLMVGFRTVNSTPGVSRSGHNGCRMSTRPTEEAMMSKKEPGGSGSFIHARLGPEADVKWSRVMLPSGIVSGEEDTVLVVAPDPAGLQQ
ncbi:hypothetical protein SELMODRAFT_422186 [Selaginella moellendorffii]|uniref:Uncharacterized protein n=1 Tax=Selaginella moellendorffii TaxID=88036 RepID=D8SHM1_SELML|nr:hypothetical protein SELMODRAFT_422186 [Selaginella moellendorffii]